MPDPKLKAAAEEIKAVLKKYDIAAMITLQSEADLEFVREISPTWSCAKIKELPDGHAIRIKAHHSEFKNKEHQKACVEATVGMVFGFMNQADRDAQDMAKLAAMLGRHFDISHWERRE